MKEYKQLTSGQRYQIYGLKQAGLNQTRIAQNMGGTNRRSRGSSGKTKVNAAGGPNRHNRCVMGAVPASMASNSHRSVGRKSERLILKISAQPPPNRLELEGELQISHEAIPGMSCAEQT
ncbi:MAG: hypothetical protein IPP36_06235 [Nitrosomonadales bacterium]|nr:hypothetical protein [Nitrosomonadales bacterium]